MSGYIRTKKRSKSRSRSKSKTQLRSRSKSKSQLKSRSKSKSLSHTTETLQIFYLLLDRYKFTDSFPPEVLNMPTKEEVLMAKIWYIKKQLKQKTYYNTPIRLIDKYAVYPEGFCYFSPLYSSDYYEKVYQDFDTMYTRIIHKLDTREPITDVNVSDQRFRGLVYVFSPKDPLQRDHYLDCIQYLKKNGYLSLVHCIENYLKFICKLYDVEYTSKFLNENVTIPLLRYEPNTGIWLHIDNIARSDQGPIITISIGPKQVYYDFTPALVENKNAKPLRYIAPEGSIFIMDGPSRMEWTHGLPYNVPTIDNKIKYTIMIKCDKFRNLNPKYNKILDHYITHSGSVC
jgi:hypothetical protein